jgi:quercetin dioxygenase-like cupin family protein
MRRIAYIAIGLILGVSATVLAMQQTYPAASPEIVLENDRVIVQRVKAAPGQWVGEHSHGGNQLVVFLKASTVTQREGDKEWEETRKQGEVLWLDAVTHDHAAKTATDAILITIK